MSSISSLVPKSGMSSQFTWPKHPSTVVGPSVRVQSSCGRRSRCRRPAPWPGNGLEVLAAPHFGKYVDHQNRSTWRPGEIGGSSHYIWSPPGGKRGHLPAFMFQN